MKKIFLLFNFFCGTLNFIHAQNVYIPDGNFKTYLLSKVTINTNGDNEIQVSEAEAFSGTIDCNWRNITSLIGIEKFINVTKLYCYGNQLNNLDIDKNIALIYLDCHNNELINLNLTKNVALSYLDFSENNMTSLDVSRNISLEYLDCSENNLASLDVTRNIALKSLRCVDAKIKSLDVSYNVALVTLNLSFNELTSLDVSMNNNLQALYCTQNQLTKLDISKNEVLNSLYCGSNQLIFLNLKNGNNSTFQYMSASPNSNLTCIQVDNAVNANSYSGWEKPYEASYSENCLLSVKDLSKSEIVLYPNPVKEVLHFSEEVSVTKITDISGRILKTVAGSIKSLNLSNLGKGTYIVTAITKSGKNVSEKFIKE